MSFNRRRYDESRFSEAAAGPFGIALDGVLRKRDISMSKLAEQMEYTHGHLSRLRVGTRKPSRANVEAICRALDLDDNGRARLYIAAGFWPNQWSERHADVLLGRAS